MKALKFRRQLSELILKGEKNVTWRLFDDKNITSDEMISLIMWESGEEFAKAKIKSVVEKRMGDLADEDFIGHEKFYNEEEMYDAYSNYYNRTVDRNTIVKIIKFEIIS